MEVLVGHNSTIIKLPSGNLLQFAIENDPVEIVDLPIENRDFPDVFCMFTGW